MVPVKQHIFQNIRTFTCHSLTRLFLVMSEMPSPHRILCIILYTVMEIETFLMSRSIFRNVQIVALHLRLGPEKLNNNQYKKSYTFACHYDVIMSLTTAATILGPFRESLISLRNIDKFWVNL